MRAIQLVGLLAMLVTPRLLLAQPQSSGALAPENGYSPLNEITAANVSKLILGFTFDTGSFGSHTAAPFPFGDLLLVLTPFPHRLFAVDLQQPSTIRWSYTPPANPTAAGLICCGAPSGGISANDHRVFLSTLDGHVIALDQVSGQVLWNALVADLGSGETLATPPLPLRDLVITGTSGDDAGARGALIALDAANGAQRWKRFSTGPDNEVGIGARFHPAYDAFRGSDLGTACRVAKNEVLAHFRCSF